MNLLNRSADTVSDNPVHQHAVDNPVLWNAVSTGLVTAGFYSIPDFIKGRGARAAAKIGITLPYVAMQAHQTLEFVKKAKEEARELEIADDVMDDDGAPVVPSETQSNNEDSADAIEKIKRSPLPWVATIGGVGALTLGLITVGEKFIYNRAERMRARGVDKPHTKQALVLAGLFAATSVAADLADRSN